MIKLKVSPISCPNPELIIKCNSENEENPMSRHFFTRETNELDGDIYLDHELKVDKDNYIQEKSGYYNQRRNFIVFYRKNHT